MAKIYSFQTKQLIADLPNSINPIIHDKAYFLEEMVRFQEKRSAQGYLTKELIKEGIYIFSNMLGFAETIEMQNLTKSYLKHLELEQIEMDKKGA